MERKASSLSVSFTALEREYIRQELGLSFGTYPSVAKGFHLRTWKSGPQAGQPRLPKAVESLVARGLMEVRPDRLGPRAYFTHDGMKELRKFASEPKFVDPIRFRHLRVELGLHQDSDIEEADG
jgi:hypothetical protein